MVGELQAAASRWRKSIGAVLPRECTLRDDVQILQLSEEVVFESEWHGGQRDWCRGLCRRDVRQQFLHHGIGADLVGFALEVQENPVAQRRQRYGPHVVTETYACPWLSAWIFAARTIACAARGLAPYRANRFTIELAYGDFGCVPSVRRIA